MKKQILPLGRIFVCTNEKAPEKSQCRKQDGDQCLSWLKEQVEKRGLKGKVRVTGTRCLGYCEKEGTAIVFEPFHEQYSSLVFADLPPLFEEFLRKLYLPA